MTADASAARSRRSILAALLGAGAASVAGAIVRPGRTDASDAAIDVASAAAGTPAVKATNSATTGAPAEAIHATSASTSGNTNAISGTASGTSGFSNGVYGETASNSGNGVYGFAGNATGYTGGVAGESDSSGGVGVWGYSGGGATGTMGVTGPDDPGPITKTGLLGVATQASGATRGVVGRTLSTAGEGVVGVSGAAGYPTIYGNIGVHGLAAGRGVFGETVAGGTGVHGLSPTGLGVRADTTSGTALRANASSTNGYALRAIGRVKLDNAAGVAEIPETGKSIQVTPGCLVSATNSAIVATLYGSNTPFACHVFAVRIDSTTQFTIFINKANPSGNGPLKVAWHIFDT